MPSVFIDKGLTSSARLCEDFKPQSGQADNLDIHQRFCAKHVKGSFFGFESVLIGNNDQRPLPALTDLFVDKSFFIYALSSVKNLQHDRSIDSIIHRISSAVSATASADSSSSPSDDAAAQPTFTAFSPAP